MGYNTGVDHLQQISIEKLVVYAGCLTGLLANSLGRIQRK